MTMAEVALDHDSGEPRVTSIGGNALTAAVPTAGLTKDVRVGAPQHGGANRGDVKRIMVSDVAVDALNGGASHVVPARREEPEVRGLCWLDRAPLRRERGEVSARRAP